MFRVSGKKDPSKLGLFQVEVRLTFVSLPNGRKERFELPFKFKSKEKFISFVESSGYLKLIPDSNISCVGTPGPKTNDFSFTRHFTSSLIPLRSVKPIDIKALSN